MTMAVLKPQSQPSTNASMLRSLKDLEGYSIAAKDGEIGEIHDFLFDDEFWTIRYVVVDTGRWLPGRKVLLAPSVLLDTEWRERSVGVALSRDQVKNSPDIDTDKPVSRQREVELHNYYGWTFYWTPYSSALPGMLPSPAPRQTTIKEEGDPHLRSLREVTGYDIEATDGDIGCVDDFIADTGSWAVRYLVVATHKWLPGKKVLVAPEWLVGPISWTSRKVKVAMTRESVKQSPDYDPTAPVNRAYEEQLYDFYGRPSYWS